MINKSLLAIVLLIVGGLWIDAASARAQSAVLEWAPGRQIEEADDDAHLQYGLVVDDNEFVHLFWTQTIDPDDQAIYHKVWDGSGWTPAADVILSHLSGAPRYLDAVIDDSGVIHMIYYVGNEFDSRLAYSYTNINQAHSALTWSKPVEIATEIGNAGTISLINNELHVVYGITNGSLETTVKPLNSDDWSPAKRISFPIANTIVASMRTVTDDENNLHVIWSNPKLGLGISDGVEYVRYDSSSGRWSEPVVLAARERNEYNASWANIVSVGDGELHFITQDGVQAFRMARKSVDGGATWSEPTQVFDLVGENGLIAPMAVDSNNALHAISHGRYTIEVPDEDSYDLHGLFYIPWEGNGWGERSPVVTGLKTDGFDPQEPKMVAYGGNKLLVVYGNDPHIGLFYTYAKVDAPAIEPRPYEIAVADAAPTEAAPAATPTPVPAGSFEAISQAPVATGINPLYVGSLLVVLLLGVFVYIRQRMQLRR